ncbi:phage DNA packaging protein J [Glutamicibacter sp.]|uniref:phage DNA packaging protein J n=1 Tax=Glutamicibacter sp. TaxID=1931995 RepID=UPI0037BF7DBA
MGSPCPAARPQCLHSTAGDRIGARLWIGQAPAPHAGQGEPRRDLHGTRPPRQDKFRAAADGDPALRPVEEGSGTDSHHSGRRIDYLRCVAGPVHQH